MTQKLLTALFLSILALALTAVAQASEPMNMDKLECMIEPIQQVEISSSVPGVLAKSNVERGDKVKKGQVLAELDSGVENARVSVAKAKAEFNKRKLARNDDMYKKELISLQERDEVETEWRVSLMELKEARELYQQRKISTPFSGVIVSKNKDAGEFTGDEPVFTLANIDQLYVELVVPVEYYGRFKTGDSVLLQPQAPISGQYRGQVKVVDPLIDAGSGTFGVRILLDNPGKKIPAGIRCQVLSITSE